MYIQVRPYLDLKSRGVLNLSLKLGPVFGLTFPEITSNRAVEHLCLKDFLGHYFLLFKSMIKSWHLCERKVKFS